MAQFTVNQPAGIVETGGDRIQINGWKPHERNTLHGLMLHEKDGSRWISFPAREWTDKKA